MKAKNKKQSGATTIEALGFILVLLASLILIVIIGAGYWNSSILNTTASSAALAGQTLVNANCSISRPSSSCTDQANQVANEIVSGVENQLIFKGETYVPPKIEIKAPSCNPQSLPSGVNGEIPRGWGYTFVQVNSKFKPLGVPSALDLRASSMATGYQSTATPNCP